ncbi:MAG: hypothetical protein QXW79_00905 [Thermoplasmata archaeon]
MTDFGRKETFEITDDEEKAPVKKLDKSLEKIPEKIRADYQKLIAKGFITQVDIAELYRKYKDEKIVDQVVELFSKRFLKRRKRAKKVAFKMYKSYYKGIRPLHEILNLMMKYKAKYKWSDAEFDEFRKELSALFSGRKPTEIDMSQQMIIYRSKISRALGLPFYMQDVVDDGIHIKETERGVLSEILSMYDMYSPLHKSVFMHSLLYEDCSLVAMSGEYRHERHIASNYIHPIIACMFLPKFDIFEVHMLYSNFGYIVKCRYEKKQIVTEPDALLYYDIITDPNDIVCEAASAITDIRNRYRVQISLWETVLKLRNGNYYEAGPVNEFIRNLNACRNNLYDNADLIYNQDEGAIMRRLLSVFSLRPTIIHIKPIHVLSTFVSGQFMMGYSVGGEATPFTPQPVHTITRIPMITLQLPPYQTDEEPEPRDLKSSIDQVIWINENRMIVPKQHSIIYSNEVLIFYVNRRIQRINIRTFTSPLSFSQLPLTMSSFERLNSYPVSVPERITLKNPEETYELRSIVAVTETEIKQGNTSTHVITGSTGLIMCHRDIEHSIFDPKYYLYDPFGASLPIKHPSMQGYYTNKPISLIEPFFTPPPEATGGVENPSFFDRASRTGTIYIYAKPTGYNRSEIIRV